MQAIWFYFPMYNTQTTDIIVICLFKSSNSQRKKKEKSKKEHIQMTIKDNLCLTLSVYYKEEKYY